MTFSTLHELRYRVIVSRALFFAIVPQIGELNFTYLRRHITGTNIRASHLKAILLMLG